MNSYTEVWIKIWKNKKQFAENYRFPSKMQIFFEINSFEIKENYLISSFCKFLIKTKILDNTK